MHGVDHWDPDGCYGCRLRTLHFCAGPAPQTLTERRWDRDMPAYARLRADGIQPRRIDGSAQLEARLDFGQLEADLGHLCDAEHGFAKKDLPRVAESMAEAQACGWTPVGDRA
jgi:hypothetical protein